MASPPSVELRPAERRIYSAAALMHKHPPQWRHPNKRAVFEIACPSGTVHAGEIGYTRWRAMQLPKEIDLAAAMRIVAMKESIYTYQSFLTTANAVEWHVNFADPHLFVAYGSPLFAQDEMQVAEHPVLGALKEALDAEGHASLTEERGQPTPVLITGVERRCHIATDRNSAMGRPNGLYGNEFARAPADVVRQATTRLDPPTVTNLIAMAAPSGGAGTYDPSEIQGVLATAFTGFRAAVEESRRGRQDAAVACIHTGFWGCGAFGGNRVIMATLQIVAAAMSGVGVLVFHTVSADGTASLEQAIALLRNLSAEMPLTPSRLFVNRLAQENFKWGVSDGN